MKIEKISSDGTRKTIRLGKDKVNAERLAKGEMFACPKCKEPVEFGASLCKSCGAFLDKETGEVRTKVTDAELQQNIREGTERAKKATSFLIAGGILLLLGFLAGALIPTLVLSIAGVVLLLMGGINMTAEKTLVKRQLALAIIPQILSEYFEDVEYDPEGTVPMDEVEKAFWGEYNRHYGSDYVKARYKGIDIQMSDLKLEEVTTYTETDEDGDTREREEVTTLLHGQWIILDFHKQLSSNIKVLAAAGGKGDVETENTEFNSKFMIFSSNPHDVFYVLTPHMMEHILTLSRNTGGKVDLMFMKEGRLHLAVDSHKDHFETGSLKDAELNALRAKFRGEIDYITAFVEELKTELLD